MNTCEEIYKYLDCLAPVSTQMAFDNAGFLIGRKTAQVSRALLSLDVTLPVVKEAIREEVQLIITHHPVIFNPLKTITDEKLLLLAENRIAVISMHTNLDIAEGGVNDVLIGLLGAAKDGVLDADCCGRVGHLPEAIPLDLFLGLCRTKLHTNGLRYYDAGRPVSRIAVLGGAGSDCIEDAFLKGCDTFITSDINYHRFLLAQELGINLIDGDHFGTEDPVMSVLREKLSSRFPETEFILSDSHRAIISFT